MRRDYSDIINLPHPNPKRHARMSVSDRAAQFAPFAALTGYGDVISKTGEEHLNNQDDGYAELEY